MSMSLDKIFLEAQSLSDESKAILIEKLVASIEDNIDPQVTKSHMVKVKRRRDEIFSGKVLPVNGEKGLAQVLGIFQK